MDRRERFDDPVESVRAAIEGALSETWSSMPGIVQSFDPKAMTVTVQPSIRGRIERPDGSIASVNLPLLVDVPVVYPGGGGFTLTFPIRLGDECLVLFADRCIDSWWQSGGIGEPLEARMHNLSDGFALVGPRSLARSLPSVSTQNTQLRTDDGATYLEIQPNGKVRVESEDLELHARHSYSWDVDGYGQRITSKGGGTYEIKAWTQGAVITSETLDIHPPEGPGDE